MRIIGGKNKGRKIIPPVDRQTRPLRDIVKESIFNLIEHSNIFKVNINNSKILDLFSGSGSFGLECISRGAQYVLFVEHYKEILNVLKKNIINVDAYKKSVLIEKNCFDYLDQNKNWPHKFNIIFLDPPYKETKINLIIEKIKENEILEENGILIIHRHKKDNIDITSELKILDTRIYGISKIIIGS